MPRRPDDMWGAADILHTERNTSKTAREMRVNLGDSENNQGIGNDCSYWGLDGFISMPNAADTDGACQAIYLQDGNVKRVIATRDNRYLDKYGELAEGDRAIITGSEARVLVKKQRDSVTIYTKNQDASLLQEEDKTMMIDVSGEAGAVTIINGGTSFIMSKDSVTIKSSNPLVPGLEASISMADGKIILSGLVVHVAGSGVILGPGSVPPIPGISSVCVGPTGITSKPSATVLVTI